MDLKTSTFRVCSKCKLYFVSGHCGVDDCPHCILKKTVSDFNNMARDLVKDLAAGASKVKEIKKAVASIKSMFDPFLKARSQEPKKKQTTKRRISVSGKDKVII